MDACFFNCGLDINMLYSHISLNCRSFVFIFTDNNALRVQATHFENHSVKLITLGYGSLTVFRNECKHLL